MDDDLIVEAEGELTIAGVTHLLLLALGSDDPEHSQRTGICTGTKTNLPGKEDDSMDAERRRHP